MSTWLDGVVDAALWVAAIITIIEMVFIGALLCFVSIIAVSDYVSYTYFIIEGISIILVSGIVGPFVTVFNASIML